MPDCAAVQASHSRGTCCKHIMFAVEFGKRSQAASPVLILGTFHSDSCVCLAALLLQEVLVHCEQQVLRFVMSYLSTTEVEPHDAAAIWGEVRRLRPACTSSDVLCAVCQIACNCAGNRSRGSCIGQIPAVRLFLVRLCINRFCSRQRPVCRPVCCCPGSITVTRCQCKHAPGVAAYAPLMHRTENCTIINNNLFCRRSASSTSTTSC
jgi:hypothetical protein